MAKYRIVDVPTNGSTGQDCGSVNYDDLPPRIKAVIDAAPDAGEWTLPALSEGDSGHELADLRTVVTREGQS